MTHVQATIVDWELGIVAGIALVRFVLGIMRRSQ